MPVTYHYDLDAKAVLTHPTGVLTLREIGAYFEKVYRDPQVEPGFVEVVLFDDVGDFAFRYTEATVIKDAYSRFMLTKKCAGTVFIAQTPLGYGIARMLSTAFGEEADLRVVRNKKELRKELPKVKMENFARGGK
jgi:hypothetical protein